MVRGFLRGAGSCAGVVAREWGADVQVLAPQHVAVGQDGGSLQRIGELADIAGPGRLENAPPCAVVQPERWAPQVGTDAGQQPTVTMRMAVTPRAAANADSAAWDALIAFSVEVRRRLMHAAYRSGMRFDSTGCASGRCCGTAESAASAAGSAVRRGGRPTGAQ